MKFVGFFFLCGAVLVSANEEKEATLEEFREGIAEFIQGYELTCENHKEACNEKATKATEYKGGDLTKAALNFCLFVANGYLCEEKTGENFVELYKPGLELAKNVLNLMKQPEEETKL